MELSLIIIRKIFMMFILIVVGYISARVGMIDQETNKKLSVIALKLITPMLIISSYQTGFEPRLVRNLLISFGMAILAYAIQIALGILFIRKKGNPDYRIERLSMVFSNAGYFGIPLIESLYGAEGAMYMTAYITMFNVLIWTAGDAIMTGRVNPRSILKGLCTPVMAAIVIGMILLFCRIRVPEMLMEPIRLIANMNTPFAMIVAGATLAGSNMLACLKMPRTYWALFTKMLLIPAVAAVAFSFIPLEPMLVLIPTVTVACPIAAACPIFAVMYDQNSGYSSQIFAVSTLLSIVTIPIIFTLGGLLP